MKEVIISVPFPLRGVVVLNFKTRRLAHKASTSVIISVSKGFSHQQQLGLQGCLFKHTISWVEASRAQAPSRRQAPPNPSRSSIALPPARPLLDPPSPPPFPHCRFGANPPLLHLRSAACVYMLARSPHVHAHAHVMSRSLHPSNTVLNSQRLGLLPLACLV